MAITKLTPVAHTGVRRNGAGRDPETQRAYQREWLQQRRQQWIAEHGPCVRCGSYDRLEVDHKDPSQKVTHNVWSWSEARREAELAKCQVLCRDCHAEKTTAYRREHAQPLPHGTKHGYSHYGCRCDACREASRAYARERAGRVA